MRIHKIAAIGGDGIGPRWSPRASRCWRRSRPPTAASASRSSSFPWSSELLPRSTGHYIPNGGLEKLKGFDAILFGAVGSQNVPDHVSLWGLRLPICQGFDQYANVRPTRVLPGVKSPLANGKDIDWVVVRENSEGEYAGMGGRVHRGLADRDRRPKSPSSRASGVERIHRFAFELAQHAPAQAPHARHQVERAALRHGDVGRDLLRGGEGLSPT